MPKAFGKSHTWSIAFWKIRITFASAVPDAFFFFTTLGEFLPPAYYSVLESKTSSVVTRIKQI